MMYPRKVAVIYSVPTKYSSSRPYLITDEDTKDSAMEVVQALTEKGIAASLFPVSEDTIDRIGEVKADCIFNMIEWDGLDLGLTLRAVGLLEKQGIPYTGSDAETIRLTADKVLQKKALSSLSLPTPDWQVIENEYDDVNVNRRFPVILKPSREHCSIGLELVTSPETLKSSIKKKLREFGQPILLEEFIEGREFQVTVYETRGKPTVLPVSEIVFYSQKPGEYLTFDSRWNEHHPDYSRSTVKLANLNPALDTRIRDVAQRSFKNLGIRDYSRLDIRTRGDEIFILEVNANPGLGDDDDYGMTLSYKAAGMTFAEFVSEIVSSCIWRFRRSVTR